MLLLLLLLFIIIIIIIIIIILLLLLLLLVTINIWMHNSGHKINSMRQQKQQVIISGHKELSDYK